MKYRLIGGILALFSLLFAIIIANETLIYVQLTVIFVMLLVGLYNIVTNRKVPINKLLGIVLFSVSFMFRIYTIFILLNIAGQLIFLNCNDSIKDLSKLFSITRIVGVIQILIGYSFLSSSFGITFDAIGLILVLCGIYSIFTNKVPFRKYKKYDLNNDNSSIKQKGEEGEAEIKHVLSWLDNEKYKVFNNVHVRNLNMNSMQEKSQQFDHIVIGTNGIFHIETKNYDGDIEIDKDGSWTRIINGERKGWESPLFQVQRHRQVLENIFGVKYPIVDIVAIANTHSNIIGKSNAPYNILKADNLKYFIENYKNTSNVDIDVIGASKELNENIIEVQSKENNPHFIAKTITFVITTYISMLLRPYVIIIPIIGINSSFRL